MRPFVLKAARIFLGCRRTSVEVNRVLFPFDRLSRDGDIDGRALLERAGIAIHGDDRIGVAVAGLSAIVGPLKGLERLNQA